MIRSANRPGILVLAGPREAGSADRPHLTFACYAGECELAKVSPLRSPVAFTLGGRSSQKETRHKSGVAAMISIKLAPR
jgi:hypothetical protein